MISENIHYLIAIPIIFFIIAIFLFFKYPKNKKTNNENLSYPPASHNPLDEIPISFHLLDGTAIEDLYNRLYKQEDKIPVKDKTKTFGTAEINSNHLPGGSMKSGIEQEVENVYSVQTLQSKYDLCILKLKTEDKITIVENDPQKNGIVLKDFDDLLAKIRSYKITIDPQEVKQQREDIINQNIEENVLIGNLDKFTTIPCLFKKQTFRIVGTDMGFSLVLSLSKPMKYTVAVRIHQDELTEKGKKGLKASEGRIEPFTIFGSGKYSTGDDGSIVILIEPVVIY